MMTFRRKAARVFSAVVLAGAGLGGLAGLALTSSAPAHADPAYPDSFVGVGSDTIQDVFNAFQGAEPFPGDVDGNFNPVQPKYYTPLSSLLDSGNAQVVSWDATVPNGTVANPGCIAPAIKLGGPVIDRPDGSGSGITALNDALNNTKWQNTGASASCTGSAVSVSGQIDFARSSNGPSTGGTTLTFVPFARDALSYAYFDHSTNEIGLGNSLSTNLLAQLFSDTVQPVTNSPAGSIQLGNGHKVIACFVNINSGTAKFWANTAMPKNTAGITVNVTTANNAATANGCANLEEHGGNTFYNFAKNLPAGTDAVIPFSVGSWISQSNGFALDRTATARANGVNLGDPDLIVGGPTFLPYDSTAGVLSPDHTFYAGTIYGRDVYAVVPTNQIQCNTVVCNQNLGLAELFTTQGATLGGAGTTGSSSGSAFTAAICSTSSVQTSLNFGFDNQIPAPDTCGETTKTGNS